MVWQEECEYFPYVEISIYNGLRARCPYRHTDKLAIEIDELGLAHSRLTAEVDVLDEDNKKLGVEVSKWINV